ncbi:hypothetical protein DRE_00431 [Drechslerella stenobrocha 248]|uniref:Uncharacterized protein n=1 Tax=Drechslerella stenobrocha 248 TaxID=1043628 RepID=W7I5M6_9PEZI|nr:hypothetical protein DRE_00431 [Drechslerella stenobrocha 248]
MSSNRPDSQQYPGGNYHDGEDTDEQTPFRETRHLNPLRHIQPSPPSNADSDEYRQEMAEFGQRFRPLKVSDSHVRALELQNELYPNGVGASSSKVASRQRVNSSAARVLQPGARVANTDRPPKSTRSAKVASRAASSLPPRQTPVGQIHPDSPSVAAHEARLSATVGLARSQIEDNPEGRNHQGDAQMLVPIPGPQTAVERASEGQVLSPTPAEIQLPMSPPTAVGVEWPDRSILSPSTPAQDGRSVFAGGGDGGLFSTFVPYSTGITPGSSAFPQEPAGLQAETPRGPRAALPGSNETPMFRSPPAAAAAAAASAVALDRSRFITPPPRPTPPPSAPRPSRSNRDRRRGAESVRKASKAPVTPSASHQPIAWQSAPPAPTAAYLGHMSLQLLARKVREPQPSPLIQASAIASHGSAPRPTPRRISPTFISPSPHPSLGPGLGMFSSSRLGQPVTAQPDIGTVLATSPTLSLKPVVTGFATKTPGSMEPCRASGLPLPESIVVDQTPLPGFRKQRKLTETLKRASEVASMDTSMSPGHPHLASTADKPTSPSNILGYRQGSTSAHADTGGPTDFPHRLANHGLVSVHLQAHYQSLGAAIAMGQSSTHLAQMTIGQGYDLTQGRKVQRKKENEPVGVTGSLGGPYKAASFDTKAAEGQHGGGGKGCEGGNHLENTRYSVNLQPNSLLANTDTTLLAGHGQHNMPATTSFPTTSSLLLRPTDNSSNYEAISVTHFPYPPTTTVEEVIACAEAVRDASKRIESALRDYRSSLKVDAKELKRSDRELQRDRTTYIASGWRQEHAIAPHESSQVIVKEELLCNQRRYCEYVQSLLDELRMKERQYLLNLEQLNRQADDAVLDPLAGGIPWNRAERTNEQEIVYCSRLVIRFKLDMLGYKGGPVRAFINTLNDDVWKEKIREVILGVDPIIAKMLNGHGQGQIAHEVDFDGLDLADLSALPWGHFKLKDRQGKPGKENSSPAKSWEHAHDVASAAARARLVKSPILPSDSEDDDELERSYLTDPGITPELKSKLKLVKEFNQLG